MVTRIVDTPQSSTYQVKVPKNQKEDRALKEGFEEDDNEDLAYFNFRLIYPVGLVSILSFVFMGLAIALMETMNHLHYERYALNQLLFSYGKTQGFCNNTYPFEDGMWPSFLRQIEMKVLSNCLFRVAVCVPMAIRIFVAIVICSYLRQEPMTRRNPFFNYFNDIAVVACIFEVLSLGLFSITTIRFDFPKFYNLMLGLFIVSATIYMFLRSILSLVPEETTPLEQIATIVRLVCTILFAWTASQFFSNHQQFIQEPGCHGYVNPKDALIEYVAIISYMAFCSTLWIEIRDVRMICYPRTCSGECEPLDPDNFKVGGKYEHCRAYEYQQHNLIELNQKI